VQPPHMRIGDTERESALAALGEHMSAGRLDIDEYGERSARIAAAKTRGELVGLFGDLPAPHPDFGAVRTVPPRWPEPGLVPAPARLPANRRLMRVAVPVAVLVALVLYVVVVHFWLVFLIPVAVGVLGGALFGDDRRRHGYDRRARREIRRRGRDW
jgi:hypothetical protein